MSGVPFDESKHVRNRGRFADKPGMVLPPPAGDTVGGLRVLENIDNFGSIAASLTDYKQLPGIREVTFDGLDGSFHNNFYAHDDRVHINELKEAIKASETISPLIVVIDSDGPYILEGAHRMTALWELGVKSFPALVVVDNEADEPAPDPNDPFASDGARYFSPEAIERAEGETGYKSRVTMIAMSPADFLAVAEHLSEPTPSKQKTVEGVLNAGKQLRSLPNLSFSVNDDGTAQVEGHEGRHRAMALERRGVKLIPVRFESQGSHGIRWSEQTETGKYSDRIRVPWPKILRSETAGNIPFPVSDPLDDKPTNFAIPFDESKHRRNRGRFADKNQTESPAFKEWFGRSRVVNADGSPKRVYHGTIYNIEDDTFLPSRSSDVALLGSGIYFTDDPADTDKYATTNLSDPDQTTNPDLIGKIDAIAEQVGVPYNVAKELVLHDTAPQVLPVYIRIERPLYVGNDKLEFDRDAFLYAAAEIGAQDSADVMFRRFSEAKATDTKTVGQRQFDILRSYGATPIYRRLATMVAGRHDGIILHEDLTPLSDGKHYLAFTSHQVKSATGNRGTFDPDDPRINMAFDESKHVRKRGRFDFKPVLDNPNFKAWAGTDNVVMDASLSGINHALSEKILKARRTLDLYQRQADELGSREDVLADANEKWEKWLAIKGDKSLEEVIETALDQDVIPWIDYDSGIENALSTFDYYASSRDKAQAELDALVSDFKGTDFETGKPVVVQAYHGTPNADLEGGGFDEEFLGDNTKAASAGEGFFFGGKPKTAESYAGSWKIPMIGYSNMTGDERNLFDDELIAMITDTDDFGAPLRSVGDDELADFALKNPGLAESIGNDVFDAFGRHDQEFSTERATPGMLKLFVKFKNPMVTDQQHESYRETTYFDQIKEAKKNGHDGLIVLNTWDAGAFAEFDGAYRDNIFVAFEPTQIKSATGNNGNFDPDDPRINMAIPFDERKHRRSRGRFARKNHTESPEFKAWFGDSKIVNEDGSPRVVYHGSADVFDQFDTSNDLGDARDNVAFFSYDPNVASEYAYAETLAEKQAIAKGNELYAARDKMWRDSGWRMPDSTGARTHRLSAMLDADEIDREDYEAFHKADDDIYDYEYGDGDGAEVDRKPNILPVYLSLQNPLVVNAHGLPWSDIVAPVLQGVDRDKYDGVIFLNLVDNANQAEFASTSVAVFDSTNIKSATGNRGTWDGNDPRINFALDDFDEDGVRRSRIGRFANKPLRTLQGEFWLDGSFATYADGDTSHEGIAIDAAVRDYAGSFGIEVDGEYADVEEVERQIIEDDDNDLTEDDVLYGSDKFDAALAENGVSDATWTVAHGGSGSQLDPRVWGAVTQGWIRMEGNNLQLVGPLTRSRIADIVDGVGDAASGMDEDEFMRQELDIDVNDPADSEAHLRGEGGTIKSTFYRAVPMWALDGARPGDLREYKAMSLDQQRFGIPFDETKHRRKSGRFAHKNQTESPNFKRWFDGSVVRNGDGSPRVVFHGTRARADFGQFEGNPDGTLNQMIMSHFAVSLESANTFADDRGAGLEKNARIFPVYLSIKNPKIIAQPVTDFEHYSKVEHDAYAIATDVVNEVFPNDRELFLDWITASRGVERETGEEVFDRLSRGESIGRGDISYTQGFLDRFTVDTESPVSAIAQYVINADSALWMIRERREGIIETYKQRLRDQGYDGLRYINTAPMETDKDWNPIVYVPLDPEQVKSATGNTGAYSRADKRINFALPFDESKHRRTSGRFAHKNQTESPAFKRWFGDSKIVKGEDYPEVEQGEPLMLYHGTARLSASGGDIQEFRDSASDNAHSRAVGVPMHFFTDSRPLAAAYAISRVGGRIGAGVDNHRIIPVYIRMERPLIIEANGREWTEALGEFVDNLQTYRTPLEREFKELRHELGERYPFADEFPDEPDANPTADESEQFSSLHARLESHILDNPGLYRNAPPLGVVGYDGVIFRNVHDSPGEVHPETETYSPYNDVYAVFDGNQVKSPYGNSGGFSRTDKRINFALPFDESKHVRSQGRFDFKNQLDSPQFKRWFGDSKVVDDGYPLVVYHGSTHTFDQFVLDRVHLENNLGQGFYFSTSTDDVNANYASRTGPDLSGRINDRIDAISENVFEYPEEYGFEEDYEPDDDDIRSIARKQLSGGAPQIYPVYLSIQNPVVLGENNTSYYSDVKETFLEIEYEYGEEEDEYGDREYLGERGTLVEFVENLREAASAYEEVDIDKAIGDLLEDGEERMSARDIIKTLVQSEGLMYATDYENSEYGSPLVVAEIIREAFELTGFDGIIDRTVGTKFDNMEGVGSGTTHYIAFRPEQVKSASGNNGNFDPKDKRINMATDLVRLSIDNPLTKADEDAIVAHTRKHRAGVMWEAGGVTGSMEPGGSLAVTFAGIDAAVRMAHDEGDDKVIRRIIGRGLLASEAAAQEIRKKIVGRLIKARGKPLKTLLAIARKLLKEFEPTLAANLYDTEIAGWILGADRVAQAILDAKAKPGLLSAAIQAIAELDVAGEDDPDRAPQTPPNDILWPGSDEPSISFPVTDIAAERLAKRNIVTRPQFDKLGADTRAQAFTVAGKITTDTIGSIRDVLVEDIESGTSLGGFKQKLDDGLRGSFLGPAHLENVYRTNVQTAMAQGQDELASDPLVMALFPYAEYFSTHDGRVRDNHEALETLGLDGTGIYRADDPFWQIFTPPWGYQCRCAKNILTVEAAARKGVTEAKLWLKTGKPPANPQHRLADIPFRPTDGFASRPQLVA